MNQTFLNILRHDPQAAPLTREIAGIGAVMGELAGAITEEQWQAVHFMRDRLLAAAEQVYHLETSAIAPHAPGDPADDGHNPLGFDVMPIGERMNDAPLLYLACPYSHPDQAVREARCAAAARAAVYLMQQGYSVFSPVNHGHAIAAHGDVGTDFQAWAGVDLAILDTCDALVALCLPGLSESKGVWREIAAARNGSIPVNALTKRYDGAGYEVLGEGALTLLREAGL